MYETHLDVDYDIPCKDTEKVVTSFSIYFTLTNNKKKDGLLNNFLTYKFLFLLL